MRHAKKFVSVMAVLLMVVGISSITQAENVSIGLVVKAGDAQKYQPLLAYFAKNGITAAFQNVPDYQIATEMFGKGTFDAAFCGSAVGGVLIIKDQAEPVARPVTLEGTSSYAAVIVAPKGSPKFTGSADYFNGKRVIFQAVASAGESYFRALGPSSPSEIMKAANHGAALDALGRGAADVAIIKNHVWNKDKGKYPQLEMVYEDKGQNPDGSLVVSKKMNQALVRKISGILLGLKDDASPEAKAVKDSLKITEYIKTTQADFNHTVTMLKKAGVTKDFTFKY